MVLNFNVKGPERKRLVQLMSEVLGAEAKYLGVPSMAYKVGDFIVSKDGEVSWPDLNDADLELLDRTDSMIRTLADAGFTPLEHLELETAEEMPESEVAADTPEGTEDGDSMNSDESPEGCENVDKITIKIPKEYVNAENLKGILGAKGELIKKALGVDSLEITEDEECVSFPWLSGEREAEEINAITHFISALCKMSRELKRVNRTEKPVENEKFTFRCFLIRLGFVGAEYKGLRKILLSRLSGNAAFRNGRKAESESGLEAIPTAENTVNIDVEEALERLKDPTVQQEVRAILNGEGEENEISE